MYAAYAPVYRAIGQAWVGLRALAVAQGWLGGAGSDWHRVVDLGCGAGECAVQMALQGIAVIGIDQSAAMLELAQAEAEAAGVRVEWRQGSIADWQVDQPVDAVVSLYDTVNYLLDQADLTRTCAAAAAALAPGGVFVFDVNTPREYATWIERATVTADTERHFVYNVLDFDEDSGIAEGRIVWFEREGDGWRRGEEAHRQRAYDDAAISADLSGAGLEIAARLTLDGQPAEPASATRIIYIARKPWLSDTSRHMPNPGQRAQ